MRLRRGLGIIAGVLILTGASVHLLNAPWLASPMTGVPKIMAHRGVHQDFDRADLKNGTCTATRIRELIVGGYRGRHQPI